MSKKGLKLSLFLPILLVVFSANALNAQILSTREATKASKRESFIKAARAYLGAPYVSGGTTKEGFDCSGLVYRAAQDGLKIQIPRTVVSIFGAAERIPDEAKEPGDLLFFNTTGSLSHVAIYLGGGNFIHSASDGPRTGVIISSLSEDYWGGAYLYPGRILPQEDIKIPDESEDTAPSVNPFPATGNLGFRMNYTGGFLWDVVPGKFPIRGALANAEIAWVKGMEAYPGVGAALAWDARTKSLSIPITASLNLASGFRFFIGTQLHLIADSGLDRAPTFPGIIGFSWNSKPTDVFGKKIRFYQSVEYSWFPNETFGTGLRFNTGVTLSCDI